MVLASGDSVLTETVFENRFQHLDELQRMGAQYRTSNSVAYISGVPTLQGAQVSATDLRAAAALIIAGLVASDETRVTRLEHLDRGYYKFHEKLAKLGATIERVDENMAKESSLESVG